MEKHYIFYFTFKSKSSIQEDLGKVDKIKGYLSNLPVLNLEELDNKKKWYLNKNMNPEDIELIYDGKIMEPSNEDIVIKKLKEVVKKENLDLKVFRLEEII